MRPLLRSVTSGLHAQRRALSSLREQALRAAVTKLVPTDLESNPHLWLSVGAVVRCSLVCMRMAEFRSLMLLCGAC